LGRLFELDPWKTYAEIDSRLAAYSLSLRGRDRDLLPDMLIRTLDLSREERGIPEYPPPVYGGSLEGGKGRS
jgi:hypothetical protein